MPPSIFIKSLDVSAPWWLRGGHAQTIWPAYATRAAVGVPPYQRERIFTPDQDFVDVDWVRSASPLSPLMVLFHGLEGNSQSHYALAFAQSAQARHWAYAVPHFRGCSGEINRAPRAYHSGDFEEIGWMLSQIAQRHKGPIVAVGVSMGGNALLRWAQEMGASAATVVSAVASIGAPLDLAAAGAALSRGINRRLYTPMFLRSMKPRAMRKLAQFPGLFDADALRRASDLHAFDNVFTAPLHGFRNTDDYWQRASAAPHMQRLKLPSLVINAENDPFVPAHSLPSATDLKNNPAIEIWRTRHGGHIGYWQGPEAATRLSETVAGWLETRIEPSMDMPRAASGRDGGRP